MLEAKVPSLFVGRVDSDVMWAEVSPIFLGGSLIYCKLNFPLLREVWRLTYCWQ
jgi:hypothetical protein